MSGIEVRVEGLRRSFSKGGETLHVLNGATVTIGAGELVAVLGKSGSGKSTFLHILGTLDRPTEGTVCFDGDDVFERSGASLDALRNDRVGLVFQFHHLLPDQDALHNVMIPSLIAGHSMASSKDRALELLRQVGLYDRKTHRPGELSGGEQQRVALARALVRRPGLLLADEPTGNLDPRTAEEVFNLLLDMNEAEGTTLVVVTHARDLASRFPRKLELVHGAFAEVQT